MPERPANGTPRKVFVSYVWADQAAVLALVEALRASGIDAWFDLFEVKPGDDIVARMNEGLERCDVAIAVFSKHSRETGWASAGVSYLTYARVAEGKPLIPVAADDTPYIPPLLRPLARRGIDQVDAIIEAIEHRGAPPPLGSRPTSRVHRVRFVLERAQGDGFTVAVELDGRSCGAPTPARLTSALIAARGAFLAGFHHGVRRSPQQAEHAAQERSLVQLGTALCDACLSRDATEQLVELLDGAGKQVGTTIEVVFDASDPELLGLPFEALRLPVDGLPAGRLLATEPAVVIFRRPLGTKPPPHVALAGPLKILVAVGAPDEGNTTSVVLDHERELNNILDAVEGERGHENVDVRFLEVGSPDEIGAALAHDAYHVLHLSCHGMPGKLELENEDGEAVLTTSTDLMRPVRESHRPLPLVLLNACHTGVAAGQTASFAEELLRAGVPAVLAMQAAVSDGYATAIAREFFAQLVVVATERPMASRALATARKVLERQRAEAIRRGAPTHETQPEYATATLFIAGEEKPLADFGLDKAPLRARTVHHFGGPVPQLDMDDLIGRRKELRGTLRTLRGTNVADGIPDPSVGVVLTGIGGVGKSAVAGRAMRRLVESGFLVPAHVGRWDLGRIAGAVGTAMERSGVPAMQRDGALLADPQLRDEVRTRLLIDVLAEHPIALVLDDFEQNLALGGGTFLDPSLPAYLERLVQSLRRGRLLVTCRHPVPGFDAHLRHIPIPPLSPAETRKLFRRLPALKDRPFSELAEVLRAIGGHPRMLEFVDALLRGGKGRLPHVTTKLKATLEKAGANTSGSAATLDEGVQKAVLLGARDVFLDELLAIARAEGIDELLLQASVSNLPVTASGLARMLAGGSGTPTPSQIGHIVSALARLDELSLLFRFGEEIGWVHRWTAEGLARLTDAAGHLERHNRAGRYRRWRIENETHALDDGIEAIRNHLTGRDFDSAADIAEATCEALTRLRQTAAAAALASEVLETLPTDHPSFGVLADAEGRAHLALGEIDRAKKRYEQLHHVWTARAAAHPARADYQRDLAVSHERMGDLYSALGLGEQARAHYQRDLDIAERLAAAEPGRADYQRDLSVSHNKMGHLYRALGLGEQARASFQRALDISERLAAAEPGRADYQRDLSVSHNRMGDLYSALGLGEQARAHYQRDLDIAERLAAAEPGRADYQRDLAVSHERMGDLYRALGLGEQARASFQRSLDISERLAAAEPGRADYQRDLSVSHNKMGDLYSALGLGEQARASFQRSLDIRERLAAAEPGRADYQRDLSVSHNKMGDLYRALGLGEQARASFQRALDIIERLAAAEPGRADYQRDLSVSHIKMGDLYRALGLGAQARASFQRALDIIERLAAAEPGRADYQRDLAVSHSRMGDLYSALGLGAQARASFQRSLDIFERLAAAEPGRVDYQRDLSCSYQRMGFLHVGEENKADALRFFQKDLGIAERLAAAEPLRADYQIDLVSSLMTVAQLRGREGVGELRRALAILHALKGENRLPPTHEPWIAKIEAMLGGVQ